MQEIVKAARYKITMAKVAIKIEKLFHVAESTFLSFYSFWSAGELINSESLWDLLDF